MTAHVHSWEPAEGVTARYRCACTAWGRRTRSGQILPMKGAPMASEAPAVTARPAVLGGPIVQRTTVSGRRTRRAPVSR